ncbi:MAG TPA: DUF3175 domain-containing protein [Candidatus Elarobacter sp.]|jgi:hypothetical protein|nr:DUF3175 domain-containing protein [Candidatus Elarobacter sp.]
MPTTKRWSQKVTETSDALDIDKGTFALQSPKAIAQALKRDAERSKRRKSSPYRSAMSMLTFYINRAGHTLSPARRKKLEAAKDELRILFDKEPAAKKTSSRKKTSTRKKAARKKTSTRKNAARK